MGYGNEVVLGFRYKEFDKLKDILDINFSEFDIEEDDDAYGDLMDITNGLFETINKKLENIFPVILEEAGFKYLGISTNKYFVAETPMGQRQFSPISLDFYFDPFELGEKLEDSVIGFALSGRYVPTFLDWENPHGTLWNITFDNEFLNLIECAKKHLIKEFPMFKDANIIIREKHY